MKHSIASLALSVGSSFASSFPIQLETREPLTSHLANIYVKFSQPTQGSLSFTYGPCNAESISEAHHTIATTDNKRVSRLAWVIPTNTDNNGCISAWTNDGVLVGRSEPQKLHRIRRRAPQKRGKGKLACNLLRYPC
jgi:hypothetical protein